MSNGRVFKGRRVIYTDELNIDRSNIVKVLENSISTHLTNRSDIEYLYNYYKGDQPSLYRVKVAREEINNRVVVNRANEIVSFKVGYLLGEPVQYVSRKSEKVEQIAELNNFLFEEDKASKDIAVGEWFYICGTAYRIVLPDPDDSVDDCPFEIYTLDPRNTFVVYSKELGNKPLLGVTYVNHTAADGVQTYREYTCYTKDKFFKIIDGKVVQEEKHFLGDIPIVEYPANTSRIGAFEVVITLLDAINEVTCDRADAIDQFVQSLMVFKGVDIDTDDFKQLKESGAIKIPTEADVEMLVSELNQSQTQTAIDDMYDAVLTICGMPSQGNGKSDSSNNGAVVLKNGWQGAETRAKDTELMFKLSEKQFIRILLNMCNNLRGMDLKLNDIDIRFTRRNYENINEKANVLNLLLSNGKVHPRLAFEYSGLFADPNLAYSESMDYADEQEQKRVDELNTALQLQKQQPPIDEERADETV